MIRPGQCFTVEASHGDGGGSWVVYCRVRRVIAGFAECHQFEVTSTGCHRLFIATPIALAALETREVITEPEWFAAFEEFTRSVNSPWNVE